MNIQPATRFKGHMEGAIKELSSALHLAQSVSTSEEFATIKRSIAHLIAGVDTVLHDSIYPDHPELNQHRVK